MDQTAINYEAEISKTIDHSGSKTVGVSQSDVDQRKRITFFSLITLLGEKLKPMLVFKGKYGASIEKDLSKYDLEDDCITVSQKNAWSDQTILKKWVDEILFPISKERLKILLLIDCNPSHRGIQVYIEEKPNIKVLWVPRGLTHIL